MYVNFGASLYMLVADGTKFFFSCSVHCLLKIEKKMKARQRKKFANFFIVRRIDVFSLKNICYQKLGMRHLYMTHFISSFIIKIELNKNEENHVIFPN